MRSRAYLLRLLLISRPSGPTHLTLGLKGVSRPTTHRTHFFPSFTVTLVRNAPKSQWIPASSVTSTSRSANLTCSGPPFPRSGVWIVIK